MSCQNSIERRQPSAPWTTKLTLNPRVERRISQFDIAPGGTRSDQLRLATRAIPACASSPSITIISWILGLTIDPFTEHLSRLPW